MQKCLHVKNTLHSAVAGCKVNLTFRNGDASHDGSCHDCSWMLLSLGAVGAARARVLAPDGACGDGHRRAGLRRYSVSALLTVHLAVRTHPEAHLPARLVGRRTPGVGRAGVHRRSSFFHCAAVHVASAARCPHVPDENPGICASRSFRLAILRCCSSPGQSIGDARGAAQDVSRARMSAICACGMPRIASATGRCLIVIVSCVGCCVGAARRASRLVARAADRRERADRPADRANRSTENVYARDPLRRGDRR